MLDMFFKHFSSKRWVLHYDVNQERNPYNDLLFASRPTCVNFGCQSTTVNQTPYLADRGFIQAIDGHFTFPTDQ